MAVAGWTERWVGGGWSTTNNPEHTSVIG
jgi:hypothetical protein